MEPKLPVSSLDSGCDTQDTQPANHTANWQSAVSRCKAKGVQRSLAVLVEQAYETEWYTDSPTSFL